MTTYRISSPRSRTDRAAVVLWRELESRVPPITLPDGRQLRGLSSADALLCDVVRFRARRIRPETRQKIDDTLRAAGYAPLSWREER